MPNFTFEQVAGSNHVHCHRIFGGHQHHFERQFESNQTYWYGKHFGLSHCFLQSNVFIVDLLMCMCTLDEYNPGIYARP